LNSILLQQARNKPLAITFLAKTLDPKREPPHVIHHSLSELREKIDAIDAQILQLINQRASCALEVAKTKLAQGETGTFYRPDRESLVLRRIQDLNQPRTLG
jgi:chorismate mutase-like protein